MDRQLVLPWWRKRRWIEALAVTLVLVIAILAATTWLNPAGRTLRVAREKLSIATVTIGTYRDFIPFRGTAVPLETIYLDALEGGRVERVLVQPGDEVIAGQLLVELSNTELELTVL